MLTSKERRRPIKDPVIKKAIQDWKRREKAKKAVQPDPKVDPVLVKK